MLYRVHLAMNGNFSLHVAGFELTTLVVIGGTDSIKNMHKLGNEIK